MKHWCVCCCSNHSCCCRFYIYSVA